VPSRTPGARSSLESGPGQGALQLGDPVSSGRRRHRHLHGTRDPGHANRQGSPAHRAGRHSCLYHAPRVARLLGSPNIPDPDKQTQGFLEPALLPAGSRYPPLRGGLADPACHGPFRLCTQPCNQPVRRDLALSPAAYGRLLRTAVLVVKGYAAGTCPQDLAAVHGLGPRGVDSTLAVMRCAEASRQTRQRLEALLCAGTGPGVHQRPTQSPGELRSAFEAHLIRRHAFSATKAELLVEQVHDAAREQHQAARACGEILFFAISQDEPAGKALSDCALVATRLAFYLPTQDQSS